MPILSDTLNLGNPVNRSCGLNRGLTNWWLVRPEIRGGKRWMNLASKNHGALQGAVLQYGPIGRPGGRGSMFCGSSIYISTAATPFSGVTQFTLSCWARQQSAGAVMTIGQSDAATTRTGITAGSGTTYLVVGNGANTYGSFTWSDLLWHHVVMTYTGSGVGDSGRLQCYFDGIPKALSFGTPIPASTHNTADTFSIGELDAAYSNGQFDDCRTYNRWMSGSEARQIYIDSRTGYKQTLNWLDVPWDVKHGEAAPGGTAVPVFVHHYRMQGAA